MSENIEINGILEQLTQAVSHNKVKYEVDLKGPGRLVSIDKEVRTSSNYLETWTHSLPKLEGAMDDKKITNRIPFRGSTEFIESLPYSVRKRLFAFSEERQMMIDKLMISELRTEARALELLTLFTPMSMLTMT